MRKVRTAAPVVAKEEVTPEPAPEAASAPQEEKVAVE
jgi:hypothetical protein